MRKISSMFSLSNFERYTQFVADCIIYHSIFWIKSRSLFEYSDRTFFHVMGATEEQIGDRKAGGRLLSIWTDETEKNTLSRFLNPPFLFLVQFIDHHVSCRHLTPRFARCSVCGLYLWEQESPEFSQCRSLYGGDSWKSDTSHFASLGPSQTGCIRRRRKLRIFPSPRAYIEE